MEFKLKNPCGDKKKRTQFESDVANVGFVRSIFMYLENVILGVSNLEQKKYVIMDKYK
jgi:hypothetical protein